MLPTKKPSLTPINQTVVTLLKPHLNNIASQKPSNTTFPVTLSLPRPVHHTINVQNVNKPSSNTTFPTFTPSKFFIERFPSWLDYHDLKKTLAKIGPVTNLFCLQEKNITRETVWVCFLPLHLKRIRHL